MRHNPVAGKDIPGTDERERMEKMQQVKRGEIYFADLNPVVGSEQGGLRPVVVIQNDIGNLHSPTVIVAAVTSRHSKHDLPTHIEIASELCGLAKDSVILLEQVRTVDKTRLRSRMGSVPSDVMGKIDRALRISLGMERR